ncbi:hypothetical protein [Streptomyces sp. NPDC051079]|uniref:hypothetical protein n=1 Tax=Streptomyces sp. NPDC051079 TaxID=3155043 RepID=UPI00345080EB
MSQQITPPARPCTYCPNSGADCCVRVQQATGEHIYAHQICAKLRGVWPPLYVFLSDGEERAAGAVP